MRSVKMMASAAVALALAAAPAGAQQVLAIQGGTVHPMSGPSYQGTVVVENGRIAQAGSDVAVPSGATVIDATGLHVYPGFFDAASLLGLTEIGSIDVMSDVDELGDFTPHLQTRTAVHPASELLPVARANGVTHTMAVPLVGGSAGGFSGQASVFHLDGWTIEEMDLAPAAVMNMTFPTIRTREFDRSTFTWRDRPYREAEEEYREALRQLAEWLDMARAYERGVQAGTVTRPDLRLDALARVARGELPVFARLENERDIRNAVEFADEQGLRLIIGGGSQAYRVADLLAQRGIPVILGPTQSLPTGPDAPVDEQYSNPAKLHQAGVEFAFATFNASDSRTLPYEAGNAVGYGLPADVALRAITTNGAQILGIGDEIGTIDPGKVANLVVTDGNPLEITTLVRHVIIEGQPSSLENRHQMLYDRYRSRPMR